VSLLFPEPFGLKLRLEALLLAVGIVMAPTQTATVAAQGGYAQEPRKRQSEDVDMTAAPQTKRTMIEKNIKAPDPVPASGIAAARKLMETGKMYRYSYTEATESPVSLCELEVTQYTGHKYCVALNSCGSALYLMLLAAGPPAPGYYMYNMIYVYIYIL
jgi:hypothetical protein